MRLPFYLIKLDHFNYKYRIKFVGIKIYFVQSQSLLGTNVVMAFEDLLVLIALEKLIDAGKVFV